MSVPATCLNVIAMNPVVQAGGAASVRPSVAQEETFAETGVMTLGVNARKLDFNAKTAPVLKE